MAAARNVDLIYGRHGVKNAPSDALATVRCTGVTNEGDQMPLRYILMDFGASFATRGRGRDLREDLVAKASASRIVVDFAEVTNVSYSFADEFVGKLVADGYDLDVVNMAPSVERSVRRAMTRRAGASVGC
jgi:hypothetical protein